MKKSIAILILLIFAASGLFAQDFSLRAGGGGLFDWSFKNGVENKDKDFYGMRNLSLGGFLFFDAAYVEIDACFAFGFLTKESPSKSAERAGSLLQGSASILLKYPLDFGRVTFFPLLGANYNMVFASRDADAVKLYDSISDNFKYLNQIGLLGGAGVDVFLKGSFFLRIEALYELRFANKVMKDDADAAPDLYTTLGMGPRVKVGVGYKFK